MRGKPREEERVGDGDDGNAMKRRRDEIQEGEMTERGV